MSASEIERTLVRLVHEIVEKNNGATDLGLVGIRRRGVPMAQRLGEMIARIEKTPVPVRFAGPSERPVAGYRPVPVSCAVLFLDNFVNQSDQGMPISTGHQLRLLAQARGTG